MTTLRIIIGFFVLGVGSWIHAEPLHEIGFELYSWQAGSQWNYAVLEGTTTAKSLQTIRGHRLKGISYLKGRLAALPAGESLYWRVDPKRGFGLPSQEIVHELNEYARAAQIKLLLPGQTTVNKANEEINTDFKQIIEN